MEIDSDRGNREPPGQIQVVGDPALQHTLIWQRFPPRHSEQTMDQPELTTSQKMIARLVSRSMPDPDIAATMGISISAVDRCLIEIMGKWPCTSRA
jgi:DNA-binding NarL/FixJ family response regulator